MPDSRAVMEKCDIRIQDVATIYGASLQRSLAMAIPNDTYFTLQDR